MIWQEIINGISIGGVYALIAVGYSLVYSVLNFSNFAHGEVLMLGAYIGYCAHRPARPVLAGPGAGGGARRGHRHGAGEDRLPAPAAAQGANAVFMISAMGLSIFLQNFTLVTIGPNFRTYPEVFSSRPWSSAP